jgi:hypothetical protein
MPNLVVSTPQQQALSRRVNVEVLSKANPPSGLLRIVRSVIQSEAPLNELFIQDASSITVGVNRELLISQLRERFPLEDGIEEVATYLADEYDQLGEGILLISNETGKAIAQITEEDYYQPAPVPRGDGHMVERPLAIRPDIEAFIIHWRFENELDENVRGRVLARINQTEALREEGDPRMLAISRGGRREIAQQIENAIPTIFSNPKGMVQEFLTRFPLGVKPEGFDCTALKVNPRSRIRVSVQDPLATNLRFSSLTATMATIANSWVRDLARALLEAGQSRLGQSTLGLAEVVTQRGSGLWVAEPHLAMALQRMGCLALPVPGPDNMALNLQGPAGILELPESNFGLNSRDLHGRWTVEAVTNATLWVNWEVIHVVSISGDFAPDPRVEVI